MSAEERSALRRIYIIEIAPRWHSEVAEGLPAGRSCFYVGETGKAVPLRFQDHLTGKTLGSRGTNSSGAVFRRMRRLRGGAMLERGADATLRFDLMDGLETAADRDRAETVEAQTIDRLRADGHCVYPKGPGAIPFESFRRPD